MAGASSSDPPSRGSDSCCCSCSGSAVAGCCDSVKRWVSGRMALWMDLSVMLKNLFAAVSILGLLSPAQTIACSSSLYPWPLPHAPSNYFTLSSSYVQSQCGPVYGSDATRYTFLAFVVVNQLVFATTIAAKHMPWCRARRRSAFTLPLAYGLSLCSFVFGACKIFIVVSYTAAVDFGFQCSMPQFTNPNLCVDKVLALDMSVLQPPGYVVGSANFTTAVSTCARLCAPQLNSEVYLLSITFALTFCYTLYMAYELTHDDQPDAAQDLGLAENSADDDEQQQRLLIGSINISDGTSTTGSGAGAGAGATVADSRDADDADEKTARLLDRDHNSPSTLAGAVSASANTNTVTARPRGATIPLEIASGGAGSAVTARADGCRSSGTAATAAAAAGSAAASAAAPRTVSSRASELEGLVSAVNADRLRAKVLQQLRGRAYFYRTLRDVSSLIKFVITVVSLSLILEDPQLLATCSDYTSYQSVSGTLVASACGAVIAEALPAYLFIVACGAGACLFVFVMIVEKRVAFPGQSLLVSASCAAILIAIGLMQLITLVQMQDLPIHFPCQASPADPVTPLDRFVGLCSNHTISTEVGLPASQVLHCESMCRVALPVAVYTLFVNVVLTFVYLMSLLNHYHNTATAFTRKLRQTVAAEPVAVLFDSGK